MVADLQQSQRCPECGAGRERLFKDGFRYLVNGPVQRWVCRDCGYRFSMASTDGFARAARKVENIYRDSGLFVERQVCESLTEDSKNLDSTQEMKTCAENRRMPTENDIKAIPTIERLLQQLRNDGRTEGTVENYRKAFARLLRENANLFDPEQTKQVLASSNIAVNNKRNVSAMLNAWFDFIGVKWKRPKYAKQTKLELPPSEKTLDTVIAGVGRKCAAYCQMLKETGARCGEISALTWKDIDLEQRLVNITPEKGSNPRIFKLPQKALDMINNLPKDGERLFANADNMRSSFHRQRQRLAKKLGDPKILEVHFHSFRIWKGTNEYHLKPDLIHVQGLLGHKNIQVTREYVRIAEQVYGSNADDGFITKIAHNAQEACQFINIGFDYVTGEYDDGGKIFKKRK